jgi:hypothetical protein
VEFNIKRSNVSLLATRGFASNSITIIKLIIMAKAYNSSQCGLWIGSTCMLSPWDSSNE